MRKMQEETLFSESAEFDPCDERLCVANASQGGSMDIASQRDTLRSNDKEYIHGNVDRSNFGEGVNLHHGDSDRNVGACSPHCACATEKNNQKDEEDKPKNRSSIRGHTHYRRDLLLINIYLSPDNDTSVLTPQNNDVNKILSLVKQLLMRRNCAERPALISYGDDITGRYYHISNNEKLLDLLKNEDMKKRNEISFDYISVGKETEKAHTCSELNRNGEIVDERENCTLLTNGRYDSLNLVEGDHFNRGRGGRNRYLLNLRQLKPDRLSLIEEKRQMINFEGQNRKDGNESENAWKFLKRPKDRDETYGVDESHEMNFVFKEKQRGNEENAFSYFQMGGPERGSDEQGKTERGEEVEEVNRADEMEGSDESKRLEKMYKTYKIDPICEEEEGRKRMMPENQTNCVGKAIENVPNRLKMNQGFTQLEGTLYQKDSTSDKPSRTKNDVEVFHEGRNTNGRVMTASEVPCAKKLNPASRKSGRKMGTEVDPNVVASVENIHTDRCRYHVSEDYNQGMISHLNSTDDPKIGKEDERGVNIYSQRMGNSSHKCMGRVTKSDVVKVFPSVGNVQTETKAERKFLHSRGKGRNSLPTFQQNRNYLHFNAWRNRMVYCKELFDNSSCHYNVGDLHGSKENVVSNIKANYRKGIYPIGQMFYNFNKIDMSAPVGELLKRESYTCDEIFHTGNRTNNGFMHAPNVNAKQIDTPNGDKQNSRSGYNSAFNRKCTFSRGMHECRRNFHRGGSQYRAHHTAVAPPAKRNKNYSTLGRNPFLQSEDSPEMCFRRESKQFNISKKSILHRIAEFNHPAKDTHYRMLKISMDNYAKGSLIKGGQNSYLDVRRVHGRDGVAKQRMSEKIQQPSDASQLR